MAAGFYSKGFSNISTCESGFIHRFDVVWGAGIQSKYVKAGTMKVLASCEAERIEMAPDAPTVQELIGEKLDLKVIFEAGDDLKQSMQKSAKEAKELVEFVKN